MYRERLARVYSDPNVVGDLNRSILALVDEYRCRVPELPSENWSQRDTFLITYGDSIVSEGEMPLKTLQRFAEGHLKGQISFLHLLPFYPWSSDDGFAVEDFRKVNPILGDWDDIQTLSQDFRLVFDGVVNHVSESSVYMKGYREGNPKYNDFFIALDPDTDTSAVLRTRNLPLLHDYETSEGTKWLWTTFSRDQLDLNFHNPAVLLEILNVLLGYLERGATMIRLDAIPYLWKKLGTSCAHLPETHELIKLMRDIMQAVCPGSLILTETNVPHRENVSYFGDQGDEAQMIYNFTLAPLIAHALIWGDGKILSQWAREIEYIGENATYLNITATHDGIGMRPTEGILSEEDRARMCDLAKKRGGDITGKRNSDGSVAVYELNINYFDFLNDPDADEPAELRVARFLLSQTIPLSFIGIPGIYIHSLLGSQNDLEGVKRTGRARSINREQLEFESLLAALDRPDSLRSLVYNEYVRRLRTRAEEPCFSPNAQQTVLGIGDKVFAVLRTAGDRLLVALHSLSEQTMVLGTRYIGVDILQEERVDGKVELAPYQARWIVLDA